MKYNIWFQYIQYIYFKMRDSY